MLSIQNISFAYPGTLNILEDVTLRFEAGRIYGLFGPNGSGKTTLLRCANHNLKPASGGVFFDGAPMAAMRRRDIAKIVAVVQQETPNPPAFTVAETVMMGRFPHQDSWGGESSLDREIVAECLDALDISCLAEKPLSNISGGERQRAMIARALAQKTRVLLMDEPASHLDISHQIEMFRALRTFASGGGTVVVVCHDFFIPPMFVDEAALLHRGRVRATGKPSEVMTPENMSETFGVGLRLDWDGHGKFAAELNQVREGRRPC